MEITLNIPDGIPCAFLNGVEFKDGDYRLFSYLLASDDLIDGNTITLPREQESRQWQLE